MRTHKILGSVLFACLFAALILPLSLAQGGDAETPATVSVNRAQANQTIIIDHTCTDLSKIPDYWLEQAKQLTMHYAHTSHGGQIRSGLEKLDSVNAKYPFDVFYAGSSAPSALNCDAGDLCMFDGNPPETYIGPEDYWSTSDGINRTRAVADTGLFDYSMWSWCGQQSDNSEATVNQYLGVMSQFEVEYPDMRFILMTGHTDGGGTFLERNNNMVRQYAIDNKMVLFDFADIETYDPLGGGPYTVNPDGRCTWCVDFCAAHPEYCTDLPSYCAHTDSPAEARLFCKLKGNAYWWMMARLAGWDGSTTSLTADLQKRVTPPAADQGQTVTYTIVLQDVSAPLTSTINLTEVVPGDLSYVTNSFTATSGMVNDGTAPTLTWTGTLSETPAVTLTYAATVDTSAAKAVSSTTTIAVSGYDPFSADVIVIANGQSIYLPLIMR